MSQPTIQTILKEMMDNWTLIENKAKQEFPFATPEEIYQITKGAMNHSLKLDK